MVSSYYYLVSSLPSIQLESIPQMTCVDYIDICKMQLTQKDLDILLEVVKGDLSTVKNETVEKWNLFSGALKFELALQRAERLEIKDTTPYISTDFSYPSIKDIVRNAISNSSPLEGERILNAAKLAYLDELEMNHYFNLTNIIVYYLRLSILERETSFDFNGGDAEFKRLLSNIQTSIKSY